MIERCPTWSRPLHDCKHHCENKRKVAKYSLLIMTEIPDIANLQTGNFQAVRATSAAPEIGRNSQVGNIGLEGTTTSRHVPSRGSRKITTGNAVVIPWQRLDGAHVQNGRWWCQTDHDATTSQRRRPVADHSVGFANEPRTNAASDYGTSGPDSGRFR
jgi:hypothetical protein